MSTSPTPAIAAIGTPQLQSRLRRVAERLAALAEEADDAGLDRTGIALRQARRVLVEEAWSRYRIEL